MTGRIITVRHGRPNLSRKMRLSAQEYGDWWARYDASGLHPDEEPPAALIDLAAGAETVLSSTLPRAVETAREITAAGRDVPADPIFIEAPLPPPPLPVLKMSPGKWGVISRACWALGYTPPGVESHRETWTRIDDIIARLAEHAENGDVVLCAHGYINWMIDRRLRRSDWRRTARSGGNRYWSWRVYELAGEARSSQPASVAAA